MKAIKFLLGVLFACTFISLSVYAGSTDLNIIEFHNPDVTVSFEDESTFTDNQRLTIAASLAGINMNSGGNIASPNNIICSLFGHDLTSGQVNVIRHKVTIWSPRCKLEVYDVTACLRCDYSEQTLVTSSFIFCHPEELPLPEGTNPTE